MVLLPVLPLHEYVESLTSLKTLGRDKHVRLFNWQKRFVVLITDQCLGTMKVQPKLKNESNMNLIIVVAFLDGIIEQVAWNKSSWLLKNIPQNTQTLQTFTMKIETESIYKSY